jgi:hypothetical protein
MNKNILKALSICLFFLSIETAQAKPYWAFKKEEIVGKKIALFGSFQCYSTFIEVMDDFESKGGIILCPIRSKIIDVNADFILFKDDALTNEESASEDKQKALQQTVFNKVRKADMVYIVNGNSCKIGLGTASEIGYTIAINDLSEKKIPIHCWDRPQSSHIRFFCKY